MIPSKIALAVHGGAGTVRREELDARRAAKYQAALERA